MTIRPEKLIVTSNYSPEQCFQNPEDIGPILRRFRVVTDLADLPPIPDQVLPQNLQPLEGVPEAPELEQVPEARDEEQGLEFREEEGVSREEQVSGEEKSGDKDQENIVSGQHDPRCNQQ